jgi:hypothetical protein
VIWTKKGRLAKVGSDEEQNESVDRDLIGLAFAAVLQ